MALLSLIQTKLGLGAEKGTRIEALNMTKFDIAEEDRTRTVTMNVLQIDATLSETHDSDVDIATHAVEEGVDISDHIRIKPVSLTIDGIVTDTPFTIQAQIAGVLSSGAVALTSKLGAFTGLAGGVITGAAIGKALGLSSNRAKDAYHFLRELQLQRQTFNVVTGLKLYRNMVLESLSVPREVSTGKAIRFTARMREIKIVSMELVKIPEAIIDSVSGHSASSHKNLGRKTKTAPDEIKQKRAKTLAARILDQFGVFQK